MKRILLGLAWGIALGCGEDGVTPLSQTRSLQSERLARAEPAEVDRVASMESHYGVVIRAHDALVQGDLEGFRAQLALVSDQSLPESAPPHWRPFHGLLRAAARQGMDVEDLEAAADAFAHVVLSCGSCHGALGMGPMFPAPAPDGGDRNNETAMLDHEMLHHKWATERLWEGITGPRNDAWHRGAKALATQEVFGRAEPDLEPDGDLARRARELREIGDAARTARSPAERAALYGRLIARCGGCHQQVGVKIATAH